VASPLNAAHQNLPCYLLSQFFSISVAVQKVIEDGIVRAILHCLTL